MSKTGSGIRDNVLEARTKWTEGLRSMIARHNDGVRGSVIAREMSDKVDEVLLGLFEHIVNDISPDLMQRVALVMHGGNGRQEVAPHSDLDLMVLFQGSLTEDIAEFSRRISQDITDTGIALGYSLRTPRDACGRSLKNAEVFTSLTESRFLAGNDQLFENFWSRFKRLANKRTQAVVRGIIEARGIERNRFGETVYLLRPNVKKSRGGLRDVHLIRWLSFVRFGTTDVGAAFDRGGLTEAETKQMKASNEFLLRIRNELHFYANRPNDGLGRNEQVRIAEKFGYLGGTAVLPVEEMMRDYFRYTSRIQYICDHFVLTSKNRKTLASNMLSPLVTRQIDEHFRMGPTTIGVDPESLNFVKTNLQEVLRLMQLCGLHDKEIDHFTWTAIRESMLEAPGVTINEASSQRFMALLSNTTGLAKQLHRLHEMRVLQRLIPAFKHARGLLQFNEYHYFTVDEHSIRAVEKAIKLEKEQGVDADVYRKLRRKNVLHLALLLHDLGKGYPEDHCEVGRRIAEDTGEQLGLSNEDTEDIKFLVHNHLVMSHLAFHRDINDSTMVAEFASNVGSVELLSMLFVLTICDIDAVGPGVLNDWKKGLLTELYLQSRRILTGKEDDQYRQSRYKSIYDNVALHGEDPEAQRWLRSSAENLPNNYCDLHSPEQIAHQLKVLKESKPDEVQVWVNRVTSSPLIELCIGKLLKRRSGIFYKTTGLLASLGLTIRSADIKPLGEGFVWYWFQFEDGDFAIPPTSRLQDIQFQVRDLILGKDSGPPTFRTNWKHKESRALQLSRPKIQVRINNQTVDTATIIDVFAYNKTGLLYMISKKIYKLGLDVQYARISTYAHQVIDVFYVTDDEGNKIRNRNQIQVIKQEILKTTENFLEPPDPIRENEL